jgi:hypothetical protein
MKCCTSCFVSPHLKNKINRERVIENCDFCGCNDECVIESRELLFSFQSIFEQYTLSDDGDYAVNQLKKDFPQLIFADLSNDIITRLLNEIFVDELDTYTDFLTKRIILKSKVNPDYADDINALQVSWDAFVKEIKAENRFHLKSVLDPNKLEKLLGMTATYLEPGKILFRGRISDSAGYTRDRMGNPPAHLTKSGRANPIGISYLYVASDLLTTLFETRAALHDYVCIGHFRLNDNIKIIDLKEVGKQDPFDLEQKEILEDYLAYLPFLEGLGNELSKPARRNDSELDYLPTQYLTEFIKSIGADGVAYGSSLNKTGKNFAVFYPEKFECIGVAVHEITEIVFTHHRVA